MIDPRKHYGVSIAKTIELRRRVLQSWIGTERKRQRRNVPAVLLAKNLGRSRLRRQPRYELVPEESGVRGEGEIDNSLR
jgi:hypothetical protein